MTIDELKEYIHELDIIDVLEKADAIKEDINNRVMLCPFHDEDTPSLHFYENSYNCFGCGANGDAFSFIMHQNDYTFLDACNLIAGAYDLELNFTNNPFISFNSIKAMRQKLEKQWEQYKNDLNTAPDMIKKKADEFYPLEVGWDKDIRYFVLRYTSKTGDTLGFTKRRGFELSNPADKGRYPKWKHSTKDDSNIGLCNNVYNLAGAVKTIRLKREVILVEGPKDTIPFILTNHKNVVAISGVSNISKSLEMIPEVDTIILSFDDDKAGQGARVKYTLALGDVTSLNNIYTYSYDGMDPYDYYKKHNKMPEQVNVLKVLDKETMKMIYPNVNPYNQELIVKELMNKEDLTHAQASAFFDNYTKPIKKSNKGEKERLMKQGDKESLRKLQLKYGLK